MWKPLLIQFGLLLGSLCCLAQDSLDSIAFHVQDKARREFSVLSLASLDKATLSEYGLVRLDYTAERGDFRKAQRAYSKQDVRFYTEGWSQLGRFHLSGRFLFNKQIEDSLSNNLRSDQHPLSPFYYFAGKAGNFNRQNYQAGVLLAYDLLPGRLMPLFKVDYRTHWTTGSVDPRPGIREFSLKYMPGAALQLGSHRLELHAILGHSIEEIDIDYKNQTFKESLVYPDRIHYINLGYGYASIKDSMQMRKFRNYAGAQIGYSGQLGSLGLQLRAGYEHMLEESTHDLDSRKIYAVRARFDLNTYNLRVLADRESETLRQQWDFKGRYQSGYDGARDFSKDYSRVNYKVMETYAKLRYLAHWDRGKTWEKELGAYAGYYGIFQADYAQGNRLETQELTLGIELRSYLQDKQKNRYILSLSPSYRLPVFTELDMQANALTPFTRQVIFTDYYYYKQQTLGLSLGFEFIAPRWIKGIPVGIFGTYQSQYSASQLEDTLGSGRVPAGLRYQAQLGFHLYL